MSTTGAPLPGSQMRKKFVVLTGIAICVGLGLIIGALLVPDHASSGRTEPVKGFGLGGDRFHPVGATSSRTMSAENSRLTSYDNAYDEACWDLTLGNGTTSHCFPKDKLFADGVINYSAGGAGGDASGGVKSAHVVGYAAPQVSVVKLIYSDCDSEDVTAEGGVFAVIEPAAKIEAHVRPAAIVAIDRAGNHLARIPVRGFENADGSLDAPKITC
jgi:hypothetical protein